MKLRARKGIMIVALEEAAAYRGRSEMSKLAEGHYQRAGFLCATAARFGYPTLCMLFIQTDLICPLIFLPLDGPEHELGSLVRSMA